MAAETINILEGSTFVVSDACGDVEASPNRAHGLFHRDTRFLSRWVLTVNGSRLEVLSNDDLQYFSAQFFLVPPIGTVYENASLSVMRKRSVGDGFHEDVTVINHGRHPVELELRVDAAADFADLFEVKDALAKTGDLYRSVEDGKLVLGYRRDEFTRETWVSASAREAELDEDGLSFRVGLEPHGEWTTCLDVVAALDGSPAGHRTVKYGHGDDRAKPNMLLSLEEWIDDWPKLSCDWSPLEQIYERSMIDLAALRFYPLILPGAAVPAAGLPWFMSVFGRDSLITSYQAMPFTAELAEATLRALAARQGRRVDDFRDEEPGKIFHEVRFGELTAFEERPHSPYYGTADSTPLFLVLLEELERWTGDSAIVLELEPAARAALAWIDDWGDRDGDGYVEYERRNTKTGLENQCWKDSWDAISFADGSLAQTPLACCEIQGYVYDAKLRCARLARAFWSDPQLAERLEEEAAELKHRFNDDFWIPEREFFALALDGEKRKVDSLTSNIGHLLWSGIADEEKAAACARHLLGEKLFSGWGVRTIAAGEGAYNPLGYHTGTVWPHDNSLIALGLARYGFRREAAQVAFAVLEAATFFRYRLPEAFAGYPRERTQFPVEFPTACSPQAWATGAPLLFLRAMLGLEPRPGEVGLDAVLPEAIGRLELHGLHPPSHRREVAAVPPPPPVGLDGAKASAAKAKTARGFFDELARHRSEGQVGDLKGSCRIDVVGAGSWRIETGGGKLTVTESREEADCVLEMGEELFLKMLRGEQSSATAFMAGRLKVKGEPALALSLARLLF